MTSKKTLITIAKTWAALFAILVFASIGIMPWIFNFFQTPLFIWLVVGGAILALTYLAHRQEADTAIPRLYEWYKTFRGRVFLILVYVVIAILSGVAAYQADIPLLWLVSAACAIDLARSFYKRT